MERRWRLWIRRMRVSARRRLTACAPVYRAGMCAVNIFGNKKGSSFGDAFPPRTLTSRLRGIKLPRSAALSFAPFKIRHAISKFADAKSSP